MQPDSIHQPPSYIGHTQPDLSHDEVKPRLSNYISLICFGLVLVSFFVPGYGVLFVPALLLGVIMAAIHFTRSKDPSKKSNPWIRALKVLAIVGVIIFTLFVGLIGLLIIAFSQGGGF